MQEESERQREKEETELRKQQKKLQDEAEKEQRRREKEDAELKKQLALKKQASLMERFLKKRKTDSIIQNDKSSTDASYASFSALIIQQAPEPVIQSIDKALSQSTNVSANNLQKFVPQLFLVFICFVVKLTFNVLYIVGHTWIHGTNLENLFVPIEINIGVCVVSQKLN